jgi:hypothetical protein
MEKGMVLDRESFMNMDIPPVQEKSKVRSTVDLDLEVKKTDKIQKLSKEKLTLVDGILNKYSNKLGIGIDQIRNFYVLADKNPGLLLSTISNLQLEITNSLLNGNDRKNLSEMYNELELIMQDINHLSQDKGNSYYVNQITELVVNQRKIDAEKAEVMADLVNKGSRLEEAEYMLKDARQNLEVNKDFAVQKAVEVESLKAEINELREQQNSLLAMYRQSLGSSNDIKTTLEQKEKELAFVKGYIKDINSKHLAPKLSPQEIARNQILQLKKKRETKQEDFSQYLSVQPKKETQNEDKGDSTTLPLVREANAKAAEFFSKSNPPEKLTFGSVRKGLNDSWLGRKVNGLPRLLENRNSAKQNKKK